MSTQALQYGDLVDLAVPDGTGYIGSFYPFAKLSDLIVVPTDQARAHWCTFRVLPTFLYIGIRGTGSSISLRLVEISEFRPERVRGDRVMIYNLIPGESYHPVSKLCAVLTTNQNLSFRSRDWLSANQGPVFPDLVGS
eukprot:sb/3474451/